MCDMTGVCGVVLYVLSLAPLHKLRSKDDAMVLLQKYERSKAAVDMIGRRDVR